MSAYCQIDDAYNSTGIEEVDLDRMARDVNDQKKRIARDIYLNHRSDQSTLERGITSYNNINRTTCDKGTDIPHVSKGFFSAQGDYSDYSDLATLYNNSNTTGTLISDICKQKIDQSKPSLRAQNPSIRVKKKKSRKRKEDSLVLSSISDSFDDKIDGINEIDGINGIDGINEVNGMDNSLFSDSESSITISSGDGGYGALFDMSKNNPISKTKETMHLDDIYKELRQKSKYSPKSNKQKGLRFQKFDKKNDLKYLSQKKCIDYDLQSIDSIESLGSGESLLEHINDCEKCRDRVIDLIRKSKITSYPKSENGVTIDNECYDQCNNNDQIKSNEHSDSYSSILEFKEILTVCLIGFLIIIILDLTMNYRS
jgi:hypothetical protein